MRQEIERFFKELGFHDVRMGDKLPALSLGQGTKVQFEDLDNRVLISLRRKLEQWQAHVYVKRMLMQVHFSERLRMQVQPGLTSDHEAILSIQIARADADLRTFYEAFDTLRDLNRSLSA